MRIFGVILAGGAGKRLGGADKAMLRLGDDRLIDLATSRFAPQVEALAISANGNAARFGHDLPVLPDETPLGPLSGLLAAMRWAQAAGADYLASCAVDTPFFPCDLVVRLHLAIDQHATTHAHATTLALAQGTRVHGIFGLWPTALHHDLAQFLASGAKPKLLDFAQRYPLALAQFVDETAFANINTAADLAWAQQAILPTGSTAAQHGPV